MYDASFTDVKTSALLLLALTVGASKSGFISFGGGQVSGDIKKWCRCSFENHLSNTILGRNCYSLA